MSGSERLIGVGMALLVLIGTGLRVWHLATDPLWLDEAYSAFAADHSFAFLWQVVPHYEAHPPFYYALLRLWVMVAGDGLLALRLPGLIAGLATLLVVGLTAARIGRLADWPRVQMVAVVAVAVGLARMSFPLVEMSRQVRPYPLLILCYATCLPLLMALRCETIAGRSPARPALVGLLLLEEALLWLHNLGPLFALAVTVALLLLVVRRDLTAVDWAWLGSGQLMVGLAYLPAFAMLLDQAPTWQQSTWVRLRSDEVAAHLAVLYGGDGPLMLGAALLAWLGVQACVRRPDGWRIAAALFVLAVLPVALSLLLSVTVAPVFITRTMTPVAVPTLLLYALGVAGAAGAARRIALVAAALLAMLSGVADVEARLGGPMEDWLGAVTWLRTRIHPGDVVFAYPNEGALPFARALRQEGLALPIRPVPVPVPALTPHGGWFPTGYKGPVSLPPARLRAIAALPATRAVPTVWLLRLGPETYDRGDAGLHAFHAGRYVVRRWRHGTIDLVGLRRLPPGARVRSRAAPARSPR